MTQVRHCVVWPCGEAPGSGHNSRVRDDDPAKTFSVGCERLAGHGIRVTIVDDQDCVELMEFIAEHRTGWIVGLDSVGPMGTYRWIDWTHNAWHDVAWSQRPLATGADLPDEPE